MKRLLVIIYVILSSLALFAGTKNDTLFTRANEAYTAGDFEEALSLYREIIESDTASAELYFNMGNAAFRSNKLGYSILYYKKALKLDPGFEKAEKNLAYVSIYKEDQLESVPEFFLKTWIKSAFSLFKLTTWTYLALIFFTLLLGGLLVYIFARSLSFKKTGFFAALLCLILFVFSFSSSLRLNNELKHPENGVIIAPSIVVKSSPSMSGNDLFVLHEGTLVSLDEEVSGWIEVKISDGRIGWVTQESVEII